MVEDFCGHIKSVEFFGEQGPDDITDGECFEEE